MEAYIVDWLSLVVRWFHVIVGIAWIGASFYFVWLDNHLQKPSVWKDKKGIKGDLWAIHGGGIYEVAKYKMAPEEMPDTLHWFKWEAYSTWLSGMLLLLIIYYVNANAYLIDPSVKALQAWQAIAIGLAAIVLSWPVYELICRSPIAKNGYLTGAVLFVLLIGLSYFMTHTFSGRGAYIHIGAIIGTIMAGNVFRVIMPSQRALITAIEQQKPLDPAWGTRAKLHSTHNTYLTLPLIFIMISNHYPLTYAHDQSWLVLIAIVMITALARHYFILKHKQIHKPSILFFSIFLTLVLAWVIAPKPLTVSSDQQSAATTVDVGEVERIIFERCATCHASQPTDTVFTVAPGGVVFDSISDIEKWAGRIKARSVLSHDMPFMNKTQMTEEERLLIGIWIDQQQNKGNKK